MLSPLPMLLVNSHQEAHALKVDPYARGLFSGPEISAMMVTRGRPFAARRAVECFLAQTYTSKELVIVDDDPDDHLCRYVAQLTPGDRAGLTYQRLPDTAMSLGELRNIAVAQARGPIVTQWDDDDVYHPDRLRLQVTSLLAADVPACALWRHQMLWTKSRRMCLSIRRFWEGSLMCFKDHLPTYPQWRQSEDKHVVNAIAAKGPYMLLDAPSLYTYIVHGGNTFDPPHFEEHWTYATKRFTGPRFSARLKRTAKALPLNVGNYIRSHAEKAPS